MDTVDKFITPCELPSPYEREVLTILIEECAEVQQRASKMLRFGVAEIQPGQPLTNRERLSVEIGDLQALFDMAMEAGLVSTYEVIRATRKKQEKLLKYMQTTQL